MSRRPTPPKSIKNAQDPVHSNLGRYSTPTPSRRDKLKQGETPQTQTMLQGERETTRKWGREKKGVGGRGFTTVLGLLKQFAIKKILAAVGGTVYSYPFTVLQYLS